MSKPNSIDHENDHGDNDNDDDNKWGLSWVKLSRAGVEPCVGLNWLL